MTNKKIYEDGTIKVGTFFSGIGAPEKALQRLKDEGYIKDYKVMFFSEIDKYAIKSYCIINNIDESLNLGSITDIKGYNLPYCDLWVGGFPCQDISCAGKMRGFNFESSTRSSLGWEMIRLLKEVKVKPKYVVFENVANITSKAFKETLNLFKNDLIELGYTLYDDVLSATDFEIPQTRKRYFLVAILDSNKKFEFPKGHQTNKIFRDYLDSKVNDEYYITSSNHFNRNGKLIFKNIKNDKIEYEIDFNKLLDGGVCGKDLHSKFHQSQRIFSTNGYSPTITASNTADNVKIVVESEDK